MTDAVNPVDSLYREYEELLFRNDRLKKEALLYQQEYVRVFGKLILDMFHMKISCIRKKKALEYRQRILNHGGRVNVHELNAWLEAEMREYQKQFDSMLADFELAGRGRLISEREVLEIKRIYRRIAKLVHPDLNPGMDFGDEIAELWDRAVTAYNCNNLEELKDVEAIITAVLAKRGYGPGHGKIDDLEDRIQRLEEKNAEIMNTDPYMYRYILENDDAVNQKKEDLKCEIKSYIDYEKELDTMLGGMLAGAEGGSICPKS